MTPPPLFRADDDLEADLRAWGLLDVTVHGDHEGWTRDSRDEPGTLTCACGAVVSVAETEALAC